jgi:hypothetical protein
MPVIERQPYRYALWVGVGIGLVSAVSVALVANLLQALLPRTILGPSATTDFANFDTWSMLLVGVFLIPFGETFIAQLLPLELGKLAGFNDVTCIAIGAMAFGAGHYLNGGLAHGVCSAIAGTLFATGYMAMRPLGYFPAFWASFVAHALNNFAFLFVIALI